MSKVICDICGTSYPETSTQCPICGCVRPAESAVVAEPQGESGGYTYVKGGRFSKANVRKRNQGIEPVAVSNKKEKKSTNKKAIGLIIVLSCLILIVGAMIAYILVGWSQKNPQGEGTQSGQETTEALEIPCTAITLSKLEIALSAEGEIWMLDAQVTPANCTDPVIYSSSNENVVTVSDGGKITCIGEGQAVITVSCGDQIAECKVSCAFEKPTEPPTVAPEGIRLNRNSITADYEGFTWTLYSGTVAMEDIVWTSDDPSVATIQNGKVVAVAEGQTMVHADYNGVRSSCTIICKFEEPTMPDENGEIGGDDPVENESVASDGDYQLYTQFGNKIGYDNGVKAYDVTVSVGESVGLYLKDSSGNTLTLDWVVTEGDSCSVEENFVTVVSSDSNCMVQAEYDGVTYYCYIRTIN